MNRILSALALAALTGALAPANLLGARAATLPNVDCAATPRAPRCAPAPNRAQGAGTVGSGPAFYQGGFDRVTDGFVDDATNTAFLAVEYGAQRDALGAILAVDLATGDRRLVSGAVNGSLARGAGAAYKDVRGGAQTAWDLGMVRAIRPLPNGKLAALVNKGTTGRVEILEIDRASGDRKLLWASEVAGDSHPGGLREVEGPGVMGARCLDARGRTIQPANTFEVDGAGRLFLFAGNNPLGAGSGLLRVENGRCAFVSGYFPDGTNIAGSGPMILAQSPWLERSARRGDVIYSVTGPNPEGNALVTWNTATGARDVVSLRARTNAATKGAGNAEVGLKSVVLTASGAVTHGVGVSAVFAPTLVNLATGERRAGEVKSGPLGNARDPDAVLVAVPNSPKVLVAMDGALWVYDPTNGSSFVLSF